MPNAGRTFRGPEIAALLLAVALNWIVAALADTPWTSVSSLGLFGWLGVLVFRLDGRAGALLLPFLVNRLAIQLSLVAIEFGASMPEIGRFGEAGTSAASYVAFCAILFLSATAGFRALAPPAGGGGWARPPPIGPDVIVGLAVGIAAIGAAAALYLLAHGAGTGFPLLTGTDRFVYRRYSADTAVLYLLNLKYVMSGLLGWAFFQAASPRPIRLAITLDVAALAVAYVLMGDKFFTNINAVIFFLLPYLVREGRGLPRRLLALAPIGAAVAATAFGLTYYVYSQGFARGVVETSQRIGERVAGQGELWFAAELSGASLLDWDEALVAKNVVALASPTPDIDNLSQGLGTFYFVQRFSPEKLAREVTANAGTTSLTGGYEALGLVMFGYGGLGILMTLTGLLLALLARYYLHGLAIGSPVSLVAAGWLMTQCFSMTAQGTPSVMFGLTFAKHYGLILAAELIQWAILTRPGPVSFKTRARPAR